MDEQVKTKKPIWKRWWFWGCIVVILIIIAASGGGSKPASNTSQSSSQSQTMKPAKPALPDLQLIESHTESDSFARYVIGTVKNNTDHQYKYVQVEINLYDSSGAQVDSTLANANNLEPKGTWKFKSMPIVNKNVTKLQDKRYHWILIND